METPPKLADYPWMLLLAIALETAVAHYSEFKSIRMECNHCKRTV